nr:MAG TPA: regulatory protein [Caudoviricetes sp.]
MYELVELKGNRVFTNSTVIAEGTGNKHSSIQRIILKYMSDFEEFGKVRFKI